MGEAVASGMGSSPGGGPAQGFPTTHWSVFGSLREAEGSARRERLNALAQLYWRPIYHYIRLRWGVSAENARDLTQEFFLHILDAKLFERADPAKSRFRTFAKACLDNFVRSQLRAARRIKRGGEAGFFQIDMTEEGSTADVPARQLPPEEMLDRQWRATVLEHAVERVRERYDREGRPNYYEVFRRYDLADAVERPRYRDVAAELGISEKDVENYLAHARTSLAETVREVVAETVNSAEALQEELRELFPTDG